MDRSKIAFVIMGVLVACICSSSCCIYIVSKTAKTTYSCPEGQELTADSLACIITGGTSCSATCRTPCQAGWISSSSNGVTTCTNPSSGSAS